VAAPEITLFARLEGIEQVTSGFREMGQAAGVMGSRVEETSHRMEISNQRLMLTTAGLITNMVQLGDIMHRMASGQMDVGRGAIMLTMNFLQLGSQIALLNAAYGGLITQKIASIALSAKEVAADIAAAAAKGAHTLATWLLVAAQKGRALASAIAAAIETYGLAVPIIAAAAAAVTVAVAAALSRIPSREFGGPIERGGIYRLHAGEFVLPRGSAGTVININEPVFRNRGDMNYLVDRLKRLGAA